jgi:hypothetical protein
MNQTKEKDKIGAIESGQYNPRLRILNDDGLISDEINDIISQKPHWILRNGVSLIGVIVLMLLLLSWVVRYPDIVSAPLSIKAVNVPKKIVAKTAGKIVFLPTQNGEVVKDAAVLAYLESTGSHDEVISLLEWTKQIEQLLINHQLQSLTAFPISKPNNLGELQKAFYDFHNVYFKVTQTLVGGVYEKKMKVLNADLSFIDEQLQVLNKQRELLGEDYALQNKEFEAKEHLASQGVIAPLELGQEKSKLIAKASALKTMETQLLEQKRNELNKRKEVIELQKEIDDYQHQFSVALFDFKNEIEKWIAKYIVSAPEEGQLQYITSLQENQFITEGQELFYIAPTNSRFYAEIIASQSGFGRLKENQEVIIKLDSYPSNEFGYIHGSIKSISPFPLRDSSFVIQVNLPEGMKTNHGKVLPFKNNLSGKAGIVTENRRLFERFVSTIYKAIER